jgi:hypothetical protein
VAGLPSRAAEVLCGMLPVRVAKATFPMPTIDISITWHGRTDADAGARFFRRLIVEAVKDSQR